MKVRFIRNTVAGGACVFIGEEKELAEKEALTLIRMGKAEQVTDDVPKTEPEPEPAVVEQPVEDVPTETETVAEEPALDAAPVADEEAAPPAKPKKGKK